MQAAKMHRENSSGPESLTHTEPHQKELLSAAQGGGLGLIGMLCSRVLTLLFQAAVARLFGVTFFGYYITGIMLCRILQVIAGMGLPIGSMRYLIKSRERGDRQAMFLIYRISVLAPLLGGTLSGGILYITAPQLCNNVFNEPNLIPVLRLFALSVPWFALLRTLAEMSRSFGTVRYTILVEDLLFPFLHICLLFFSYIINGNALTVVLIFFISSVSCATIIGIVVYRQIEHCIVVSEKKTLNNSASSTVRELLTYSIPLMPSGIFFMVSNNIDIFMLNILNNGGAVGIYAAATRWTLLIDAIGMPIYSIFRPLIGKAVMTNNLRTLRSLFMASCRWVMYIILPLTTCLVLASQPAMESFTKEQAAETASLLLWILLAGRITNPLGNGAGLVLT
ncbi:MAG: hypothetical protein D3906_02965, partial [Candidatus Electrothrix sp. AUS1_2]|nr:hypothetical protein [Candidatus Electrothrix sp. AUS1_2]